MKCPVCQFDGPINRWMTVPIASGDSSSTKVAPQVNYYPRASRNQYNNIYACPKCGVLKIRKFGDT